MAGSSKAKVGIVVCGAAGRMGRRIIALATEGGTATVTGAVEAEGHPDLGVDAGELAGVGNLAVPLCSGSAASALVRPPHVTIDFSTPEGSLARMREAAAAGAPIVIGATGFSTEQREEALSLSKSMPTLLAPNMSLGSMSCSTSSPTRSADSALTSIARSSSSTTDARRTHRAGPRWRWLTPLRGPQG